MVSPEKNLQNQYIFYLFPMQFSATDDTIKKERNGKIRDTVSETVSVKKYDCIIKECLDSSIE